MVSAVGDPIEARHEAVRRRAWEEAYREISIPHSLSKARTAKLKGFAEAVPIVAVDRT
jgi:hypothetical protein